MTTTTHLLGDSATMLRRDLRHLIRYPSVTVMLIGMPVVFLLLFVYVLGGTLGDGLGEEVGGRAEYLDYVVPGILLIAIAAVAQGTAISVAMDMTEGIIARFRTMAISRTAVLTGHVGGSMVQTFLALAVVTLVAVAMGYRASAGVAHWLAVAGVLAMVPSLSPGSPSRWAWPQDRSSRPATRPCSSSCCPSSAAPSPRPTPCRPPCSGSPPASRSRPSSTRSGGSSPARPGRQQRRRHGDLVRRHRRQLRVGPPLLRAQIGPLDPRDRVRPASPSRDRREAEWASAGHGRIRQWATETG